jgi:hypothetical protein
MGPVETLRVGRSAGIPPLLALFVIEAMFWTQAPWVRRTNFGGFDEWTIHFLLSRRIVAIPYANRPLELFWELPAAVLSPHSFLGYHVLYAVYMPLAAWLAFLLIRAVAPGRTLLALLTGVFIVVWAPSDVTRLGAVERTLYTGFLFGLLTSAWLWLESWRRGSRPLLALSVVLAVVTARSYEGTIPLQLLVPFLGLRVRSERGRLRLWAAAWEAAVVGSLAFAAWPILVPRAESWYQTSLLGLDAHPAHVLGRLAQQCGFHLMPLFRASLADLARPAVCLATLVFLLGLGLAWKRAGPSEDPERRELAVVMAMGLGLAILGYGLVTVSARLTTPSRMQYLSAPGIGLLLGAAALFVASLARRFRMLLLFPVAAWVVAVGTSQTLSMQRSWDGRSYFTAQQGALRDMMRLAPDLAPGTLVVLLDHDNAWPAGFAFRHAVEYLYQRKAVGYAYGAWDGMFPTRFEPDGVHCEPWLAVREAWDSPPALYPYDRLVVFRRVAGTMNVLDSWPSDLPPLPEGARYAPGGRILSRSPSPEWALLSLR